MTTLDVTPPDRFTVPMADTAVYQPQEDTALLIEAMIELGSLAGRRVADLCTGSGAIALAAAAAGADEVTAFDLSPSAVDFARGRVSASGQRVSVRLGSFSSATESGPYDLVLCNPPYVPIGGGRRDCARGALPPVLSYDGGCNGRKVLDPLCAALPALLERNGTVLLVQSELAGTAATVAALESGGLQTSVTHRREIPFGPVLQTHAGWLQATGKIAAGAEEEIITVIAGVKR